MKNRFKLVTIITKEVKDERGAILQREGLAVRVPRGLGEIQVDKGLASYTSKGRYKHIVKEQRRRERREAILEEKRKSVREMVRGHKRKPNEEPPSYRM